MNAFNYVFTDVDMQTWSSQLAQIQTKHQKEEERSYKWPYVVCAGTAGLGISETVDLHK